MGLLDICCVLGMRSALVNQPEGSPTSRAFASQVSQAGDAHVLKKKKKKDLMGACRRKGFLTTDRKAKKRKSVVGQGKGEKQREAMERRPEEPGPEQVLGAEQGRCQG